METLTTRKEVVIFGREHIENDTKFVIEFNSRSQTGNWCYRENLFNLRNDVLGDCIHV